MPYAVIDLETTGFSPKMGDRVLEVGVVLVDDSGAVEGEWGTLVNPQRDVGATHVHGIQARDVVDAPLFGDITPHLTSMLAGRTLVAHNQAFDVRFLRAELAAHGHALEAEYRALCTMLWSRRTFGAAKLADVCALLGIDLTGAHAALHDARATSGVLEALMRNVHGEAEWRDHVTRAVFGGSTARRSASAPATQKPRQPIAAGDDSAEWPLWQRTTVPVPTSDANSAVYLELVGQVLDDGVISIAEHERLDAIADIAGVGERRRRRLHAAYLDAALHEATADGVVTGAERTELEQIAAILDLEAPVLPHAAPMGTAPTVARPTSARPVAETETPFTLAPGSRVAFTGTLNRPRDEWAQAVARAGLVTGSVTKSCAVLVAADPASQSGKAKTATKHGIPIVTELEFAREFEAFTREQA